MLIFYLIINMKGKTAQPKGRRGKGIGSETGGNP